MNTTSASLNSRMKSRVGIFCRRNSYLLSSLGACSGRNEHGVLITLKGLQMLGWYCHSKHSRLGWVGYKLGKHVGTELWITLVYGESRSLCYAPCFCQRPERVGFTYNSWQDFGHCGESLKLFESFRYFSNHQYWGSLGWKDQGLRTCPFSYSIARPTHWSNSFGH